MKELVKSRRVLYRKVVSQSVVTPHNPSFEKAEDQRFKFFPRNIELHLKIDETEPLYMNALAVNDPDPDDDDSYSRWIINIYLNNFSYRKNVDYKRVATDVNNTFLVEYICAIIRFNTKDFKPLCDHNYAFKCACDYPLEKGMRIKIQRIKMIKIEEEEWKKMCLEVENQRLTKQQLKRKITSLSKTKGNYFEALKEIYSMCLDQGKHAGKIELIKEICRKYKIPKKV